MATRPSFTHAFEDWIDWLVHVKKSSPHTVEAYERDMRDFLAFLTGHIGGEPELSDLEDLRAADFRAYLAYRRQEGLTATSLRRVLSSIRSFFKRLEREGYLHNPYLKTLKTPKAGTRLPRPLAAEDTKKLLDGPRGKWEPNWVHHRDLAVLTLLYGCGLRIGEALALNYETRPRSDAMTLIGKGNKERMVPVLPAVRQAIDLYLKECPFTFKGSDPLFIGRRGKRLSPRAIQLKMEMLRRKFGLPETATPHALRHSFASHLLAGGSDLRSIQELLGHASLSSTQRYTDLDTEKLLAVYDKAHPKS
ncbi:tyrosine-type recombinase/integrase [Sneathiella chungangensis]|uniref:Tyrosine recombinase XerC n=1 Tax=Sneathiella chungangensis TaxID=1418234 RepID=A0A845MIB7_9PROT|nr:tyrosine recombinase XerC [Sneathiella chungangensis]MZR23698.1 tyrosine-type recombinase/integrase [Sneathiella chungangensis]